jgi:hypothetical protein
LSIFRWKICFIAWKFVGYATSGKGIGGNLKNRL